MATRRAPAKTSKTKRSVATKAAAPDRAPGKSAAQGASARDRPIRGRAAKSRGGTARDHQRRVVREAERSADQAGKTSSRRADRALGDATVQAKTGRGLEEWFARLDAWGAVGRPHREIARHLADDDGQSGWWAQMITVEYERARGLREVGQTKNGYEAQVQKTLTAEPARVWAALLHPTVRQRWLGKSPRLRFDQGSEFTLGDGTRIAVRKLKPEALLRLGWEAPQSTRPSLLEISLRKNPSGRTTLRFQHRGLRSQAERSALAAHWQHAAEVLDRAVSE